MLLSVGLSVCNACHMHVEVCFLNDNMPLPEVFEVHFTSFEVSFKQR